MIACIITIVILLAAIIVMGIGIKNLLIQNEALEDKLEFYEDSFETIRRKILDTEVELTELDIRGSFAADDEVGFVFKQIKELSTELNNTVQTIYESRD